MMLPKVNSTHEYLILGPVGTAVSQSILFTYSTWDDTLKEWFKRWQYPRMKLKVSLLVECEDNQGYKYNKTISFPLKQKKDGSWSLVEVIKQYDSSVRGQWYRAIMPRISRMR